jgi:hypothetical protein
VFSLWLLLLMLRVTCRSSLLFGVVLYRELSFALTVYTAMRVVMLVKLALVLLVVKLALVQLVKLPLLHMQHPRLVQAVIRLLRRRKPCACHMDPISGHTSLGPAGHTLRHGGGVHAGHASEPLCETINRRFDNLWCAIWLERYRHDKVRLLCRFS